MSGGKAGEQGALFSASGPPNPFAELLRASAAPHVARALRAPVERLSSFRPAALAEGRALRVGGEVLHAQTIGSLIHQCAGFVASRPVWMRHPEARALHDALRAYVAEAEAEVAMDALRLPAPPEELEGLRRWAASHRVDEALGRKLGPLYARWERQASSRARSGGLRTSRVEDIVARVVDAPAALRAEVHDWLWARAERRALALREEAASSFAAPSVESMAAFAAGLEALRAGLRAKAYPEPRGLVRVSAVSRDLDRRTLAATVEILDEPFEPSPHLVSLTLGAASGAPPSTRCACDAEACTHGLALVDRLRAIVADEHGAAARELRELLETAPWKRALERLGSAVGQLARARPAATEESLAFLLEPVGGLVPAPTPILRREGEGGAPKLSRLAPSALSRYLPSLGERAPLVGAMIGALRSLRGGPEADALRFELLAALVGHPHVYARGDVRYGDAASFDELELPDFEPDLDGEGEPSPSVAAPSPVELRVVSLELRAVETEGGVALVPFVDGVRALGAAAAKLPAAALRCVFVDAGAGTARLLRIEPAQRALLDALGTEVAFPREAHGPLLASLAPVSDVLAVDDAALPAVERTPPSRTFVLRLEPVRSAPPALLGSLLVQPAPAFEAPPGAGPTLVHGESEGRVHLVHRDLAGERARAEGLVADLGLPPACSWPAWHFRLTADAALPLVARLTDAPPAELVVEWRKDPWKLSRAAGIGDLRVRVEKDRDWFGVEGGVELDGEVVPLRALLSAVAEGRDFVPVGEGRWVRLSAELRRWLDAASDHLRESKDGLFAGPASVVAFGDLLDGTREVALAREWRALRERVRDDAPIALPEGLRAELRGYQAAGVRWLLRLSQWGVGGVLADDMGLGKTLQALAVLLARAPLGPALVVAPTSLSFNWQREVARFTPALRLRLFSEARDRGATVEALGAGEILVASYGLCAQESELLSRKRFSTLVLDEAQQVKNAASQRARAVRDLDAQWRVALSGTPLENHLGELWSVMRAVQPGLFGSLESFRRRFAQPIERGDGERRQALAKLIRPFVLRRTKAMVAPELPPRVEVLREVELGAEERARYDGARAAILQALTAASSSVAEKDRRFEVLAALTRLRQLACHPRLCDGTYEGGSAKLDELLALVSELREEGHRALVFSQFTSHLALVREAFEREAISYQYLDGETPPPERARRVDAFQRGDGDAFLISLRAGGVGLNLTAADYVVHLDPWWNPAVEDQATDRAHRIGQTRPVTVYRLVAKGTIEESILALHDDKRALVEGVLEGASTAATLSTDELVALLREG